MAARGYERLQIAAMAASCDLRWLRRLRWPIATMADGSSPSPSRYDSSCYEVLQTISLCDLATLPMGVSPTLHYMLTAAEGSAVLCAAAGALTRLTFHEPTGARCLARILRAGREGRDAVCGFARLCRLQGSVAAGCECGRGSDSF